MILRTLLIVDADTGKITKERVPKAGWGFGSTAVVGNKVVMGRGGEYYDRSNAASILIIDTEKGTVTEKGGLSKAVWGCLNGTTVVGNKVIMYGGFKEKEY